MASSRKSASADPDALYRRFLSRCEPVLGQRLRLVVAFSGGLDSTVLLDLLARARARAVCDFSLAVFHVHHGLSPNAGTWLARCRAQSESLGLPFSYVRLDLGGEGNIEARARAARYEAFARLGVDRVVLGHHRDDQAETVLYRLARGAGVHGAAGMPALRPLPGGGMVWRPLLDERRADLEAYARARCLRWIEDESNAHDAYDRNYLRSRVLPAISARFPHVASSLARAAGHFAEAAQLLDELACADAGDAGARLPVARLDGLTVPRQRNLLRWFLARRGVRLETAQLEVALTQMLTAGDDRNPSFRLGDKVLHRYRDMLWVADWVGAPVGLRLAADGDTTLLAPLRGCLRWSQAPGGIAMDRLGGLQIRLREGGEALRPHRGGPMRPVKHLFQEAGIPPWLRGHWPLLWRDDVLLAVPGIAVAAEAQSSDGRWPRWVPDDWPDAP